MGLRGGETADGAPATGVAGRGGAVPGTGRGGRDAPGGEAAAGLAPGAERGGSDPAADGAVAGRDADGMDTEAGAGFGGAPRPSGGTMVGDGPRP